MIFSKHLYVPREVAQPHGRQQASPLPGVGSLGEPLWLGPRRATRPLETVPAPSGRGGEDGDDDDHDRKREPMLGMARRGRQRRCQTVGWRRAQGGEGGGGAELGPSLGHVSQVNLPNERV